MSPALLDDLRHRATQVAHKARALDELIHKEGPRLNLSDDQADADLLVLAAVLNDLDGIDGRLRAALAGGGEGGCR
jgi:hypothetical protein